MVWTGDPRLTAGPRMTEYLHSVFVPGTRLGPVYDLSGDVTVVELIHAATIRIPSGRLGVGTPWPDDSFSPWHAEERPDGDWWELAERIPPGAYRVETAWTSAPFEYQGRTTDMRDCCGTRLVIRDEPVVGWEMALGAGERVEDVPEGLEPGVYLETGLGCFADAAHWGTLTRLFRKARGETAGRPGESEQRAVEALPDGNELVRDDRAGADLVTLAVDDGTMVSWLGRTAEGEAAAVVVAPGVMMLSNRARIEPRD
ncbi:DUF4241 domain-containing protein [Streptomyces sp. NPDC094448]|uniref:DUF4241 domain-containing protein n=1 Tax=Streptomyces sp. NPDC094448 TaxID=3366063 RepID=UPI00380625D5